MVFEQPGERLARVLAAVDAANADDPNTLVIDGVARPKEQAHAELMTEWVGRLDPDADDAQLVAARAHHLRRWTMPRSEYSEGRAGYLRWRTALGRRHGAEVAEIVMEEGYDEVFAADVAAIVAKRGLTTDPRVQTHEDALCLVFLQTQLDQLADKLGDDHTAEVLAKTWAKMSPAGRHAASSLPLGKQAAALLAKAVGEG